MATYVIVSGGNSPYNVSSGGTDLDDVVVSGGSMFVLSAGVADFTTVSSGGFLAVAFGGTGISATVSSSGSLTVSGGGTDLSATVLGGGSEFVASGAYVSGETIRGGIVEIASGGSVAEVVFSGGGTLKLDNSVQFGGLVADYGRPALVDLTDIPFNSSGTSATTVSFVQSGTSGTLTVTDGAGNPTAHITLVGEYLTSNLLIASDGHGGTQVSDRFSVTPNPISASVQKDTTTSATGQLTANDATSGATLTWTVSSGGASATTHSPDYSFAINEFKIVQNGGTTFDDTFSSSTPPPYSGNPTAYNTTGTIINSGSSNEDLLLGSNSVAVGTGGTDGQISILETDTTSNPDVGLKSGTSFTVSGVFDLVQPEPHNAYGIELTDGGGSFTSGSTGGGGHDQVRIEVELTGANTLVVELIQKDATVTGAGDTLQSFAINPGSATQIELQLSNNGAVNNGQVSASFSLLSAGVVQSTTDFTATGQIFLPPDGSTTPEDWTRPGFFAFAPAQSDVLLSGTYGTLDVTQTGAWTYGLANSMTAVQQLTAGQTLSDNFTVTATDNGAPQRSASVPINITIEGENPTLGVEIVPETSQGNPGTLKFSQFLAFGDSNIDSGYFLTHPISTNPAVEAQYQASVAAGGGVPTSLDTVEKNPGRLMNSELLAGDYGLTALPVGMNGGTNFAASGATVTAPLAGSLAPTIDSQIQNYLISHNFTIDPNTLILLSGGGNDAKAAETMDPASGQAYMVAHAQLMAADIAELEAAGARYIIMGDMSGGGTLGQLFTNTLRATLAADGLQFISADTAQLVTTIQADPAAYGIVNADKPPQGPFSNSFQYSPDFGGADVDPIDPATGEPFTLGWANYATQLVSANAGQTNLYADDEHLAAAGHQLEANYNESLIQNAVPSPGETLTANPSLIGTTASTASVTYQWRRLALGQNQTQWSNISGATGSSYEVSGVDEGSRLDVEAFFTDPVTGQSVSATSVETFAVAQVVGSGQTSGGITVLDEGTLIVSSGGTATGTMLSGGAQEFVSGTDSGSTISGGATQTVFSGGTEVSGTVLSGGVVDVLSGGTALGMVLSGGTAELAAGAIAASGAITFAGVGGELRIDGTTPGSMPTAVLSGLRPGDTIDLTQVGFNISGSITTSGSTLVVKENGQAYDFNLDPSHSIVGWELKLSSDGATGTNIRLGAQRDDFDFDRTSDILFRNDSSGDTWFEAMSNGAFNGWNQIGGSSTSYAAVGVGDFYGTGTSDALFLNVATGDTWVEAISNGAFAGWSQIGGSDTHYSVVGVADFYGSGTDDILFRNNSTGDTWFEAISNGAFAGWNQIGGSNTTYAVVGTGDFYGNGTDNILFRNNSTGDTWIEAISNGAFNGWHQIGGSDTHYAVVGVGDFFGNGTDDILFRNNSSGDTWIEAISNGAFKSWNQIGGSDTSYAVVAVGDYFGNGTDDILFRNNSTGDTWFEAISNGSFNGWHQVGGSNTGYTVKT
jgi:VCBS repeat-containing protein/autotransporter passenger strand-loop-strand repeat protein